VSAWRSAWLVLYVVGLVTMAVPIPLIFATGGTSIVPLALFPAGAATAIIGLGLAWLTGR